MTEITGPYGVWIATVSESPAGPVQLGQAHLLAEPAELDGRMRRTLCSAMAMAYKAEDTVPLCTACLAAKATATWRRGT